MPSTGKKKNESPIWNACTVSIFGIFIQLFFIDNLDVEPLFGPGGVKAISALAESYPQRDWGTWLMHWLLGYTEQQPEIAARLTVLLGSTATIFGISLAGSSISDTSAGRWLGIFTACYAPLLWNSVLIGPDAIATGVVWLGLGFAYYGASKKFPIALFLSLFGAFCCIFAAKIKITAFPATTFIGLLPLLAFKPKWHGKLRGLLLSGLCLAGLLWLKNRWMSSMGSSVSTPSINFASLKYGWAQLQRVFDQESVLVQLSTVALFAVFIPRKNFFAKFCLAGLCCVAMLLTASTLGDKIRPRYFVATSLPALLILSSLFSYSRSQWIRYIQTAAGIVVTTFLLFDSIAYHTEWAKLMHRYSGTELSTLPEVPSGWTDRYLKFSRIDHDDHSTIGAKRLHQLATEAKTETVMGIPLRDGRDYHLKAAAQISSHKALILTSKFCCSDQPDIRLCAQQTLEQISKSSTRMILPIIQTEHARIPNSTNTWYRYLLQASREYPNFTEEAEWGYLDGDGSQSPPCLRPPRRQKGLWNIDGEGPIGPNPNTNQQPKRKRQY